MKGFRGFVIGFILTSLIIASGISYGEKQYESIDVLLNRINILVNGKKVEGSNILYSGVTYVPLREIARILNKEVEWDGKSNTASIKDSKFEKVKVTRHIDGDTVVVTFADGREEKLRLIGVNTPETLHPNKEVESYGKEASEYTKSKLLNTTVYLEKDISETDVYGRLLRYVWLYKPIKIDELSIKNNMFNAILILDGYGQVSTYPPDVKYIDFFNDFQTQAINLNKGLWSE